MREALVAAAGWWMRAIDLTPGLPRAPENSRHLKLCLQ
jgi:hypothetical protein